MTEEFNSAADSNPIPRGVRVGIDAGKARIGVAKSDPDGLIASAYATVKYQAENPADTVAELLALFSEIDPVVVYLGYPLLLSGAAGAAVDFVEEFAALLVNTRNSHFPEQKFQLRFLDERLTTVSAHARLTSVGKSRKQQKGVVDEVAASIILESALAVERAQNRRAGRVFEPV